MPPRRPDLDIDTPSADEGHETFRLAIVAARKAIADLRTELDATKTDVAALKTETAALKARLDALAPPPTV